MPYTDKFYEDSEMTQIPPAGYVVIFNGYSEGVSAGQKVLRMLNSEGVFSNVSSGSAGGSGITLGIIKSYNPETGTASVQDANDDWTENASGSLHENVIVP